MKKDKTLIERWAEDKNPIGAAEVEGYTPVPIEIEHTNKTIEELLREYDTKDTIEEV